MKSRSGVVVAFVLATAALLSSACGGSSSTLASATPASKIRQLPADALPKQVLGLTVGREDMSSQLKGAVRSYTDAVGMYSFRKDDLLQATLEITRFNDKAQWSTSRFRAQVVSQIGGSVPRQVRAGDDTVYLTRGTKQSLSIWFRGRYLYVLAVREEYLEPRALLREALKIRV